MVVRYIIIIIFATKSHDIALFNSRHFVSLFAVRLPPTHLLPTLLLLRRRAMRTSPLTQTRLSHIRTMLEGWRSTKMMTRVVIAGTTSAGIDRSHITGKSPAMSKAVPTLKTALKSK